MNPLASGARQAAPHHPRFPALVVLLLVLPLALSATPTAAAVIRVPDDAPTIAAGLALAAPGDEVVVAAGTWFESGLVLPVGVTLRGETGDPQDVRIDALDAGTALSVPAGGAGTRLQGVTFARGSSPGVDCRGATEIRDCVFRETFTGFGLEVHGPVSLIEDCRFVANDGGMLASNASTFRRCEYRNNSTGASLWTNDQLLEDCVFKGNSASGLGGGVRHRTTTGVPVLRRCRFEDNSAQVGGGAEISFAGAVFEECEFVGNRAVESFNRGYGAGINANFGATIVVTDCIFRDQEAATVGGAIHVRNGSLATVSGCVFDGNTAAQGGGVSVLGATAEVTSSTFHGNGGENGGGALSCFSAFGVTGRLDATLTIAAFSLSGGAVREGVDAEITLSCADLFGNEGGDWTGGIADQADLSGNFSADPMFCGVSTGDFSLRANSPCAPPGVTGCGLVGALGVGCGPIGLERRSWARIKAPYR